MLVAHLQKTLAAQKEHRKRQNDAQGDRDHVHRRTQENRLQCQGENVTAQKRRDNKTQADSEKHPSEGPFIHALGAFGYGVQLILTDPGKGGGIVDCTEAAHDLAEGFQLILTAVCDLVVFALE